MSKVLLQGCARRGANIALGGVSDPRERQLAPLLVRAFDASLSVAYVRILSFARIDELNA